MLCLGLGLQLLSVSLHHSVSRTVGFSFAMATSSGGGADSVNEFLTDLLGNSSDENRRKLEMEEYRKLQWQMLVEGRKTKKLKVDISKKVDELRSRQEKYDKLQREVTAKEIQLRNTELRNTEPLENYFPSSDPPLQSGGSNDDVERTDESGLTDNSFLRSIANTFKRFKKT